MRKKSRAKSSVSSKSDDQGQMFEEKCTYANFIHLRTTDPAAWTIEDVGMWVAMIGFSDCCAEFQKQRVAGEELIGLTEDDLKMLGLTRLGPRKLFMGKLKKLTTGTDGAFANSETASDASGSSASSKNSYASTDSVFMRDRLDNDAIPFKLRYKGDAVNVQLSGRTTFAELKKIASKEFGGKYRMTSHGKKVRKTVHVRNLIKKWDGLKPITINLKKVRRAVSVQETSILDCMNEAVVTIDFTGKVLVFNTAAEKLFGYARREVVGKSASMLLPSDGKLEDVFIPDESRTKKATVKDKSGNTFPVMVSSSRNKAQAISSYTSTIRKVEEARSECSVTQYSVFDSMTDPVIVTNSTGIMDYVNQACCEAFGFPKENMVGHNVTMLMSRDDSNNHDRYMQNYIETGISTIIGRGRKVVCVKADGGMFAVHLSVTATPDNYFVGVMQTVSAEVQEKKVGIKEKRVLVNRMAVPGFITNHLGQIDSVNKAFTAMAGYTLLDTVSQPLSKILEPSSADTFLALMSATVDNPGNPELEHSRDCLVVTKTEEFVLCEASSSMIVDNNKYIFTHILTPKN
eukprot:CAMPEP_0174262046 /NCGR_PEP_ID=MMETSP0439-20130205/12738_1 /TAXON_ID=0 /ORGANISM="Stereomyxa ramosa, Strain Chinc5" /LENGTH=572 /DNA_ID=CAMNT_0015346677 /DNA_START=20 /DNA_END=1738 /DNA_ORIENTATION=+